MSYRIVSYHPLYHWSTDAIMGSERRLTPLVYESYAMARKVLDMFYGELFRSNMSTQLGRYWDPDANYSLVLEPCGRDLNGDGSGRFGAYTRLYPYAPDTSPPKRIEDSDELPF